MPEERQKGSLKSLVKELGRDKRFYLQAAYGGLKEEPTLKDISTFLDIDELFGFAAESWIKRDKDLKEYERVVDNSSLYEIFSWTYQKGGHVFLHNDSKGEIRKKNEEYNKKLSIGKLNRNIFDNKSPHDGRNLKQRLDMIPYEHENDLRAELKNPTFVYCINDMEYFKEKGKRKGDNSRLRIIYNNKGWIKDIPDALASKVSQMLEGYEFSKGHIVTHEKVYEKPQEKKDMNYEFDF